MIKYEIKKNIVYNKVWILIVLILLFPLLKNIVVDNRHVTDLEADHHVYYHQRLHGVLDAEKLSFLDSEAIIMKDFEVQRNVLIDQYKNSEISDKEYIGALDNLNAYGYRRNVFDVVQGYVKYLKTNENTSYINEINMNHFFNFEIPYFLIATIILITVISFQNEKGAISLINTTINGKRKLIFVKIHTLIIINTIIFTLYFVINSVLNFDLNYSFELLAHVKSSRMFETSFLNSNFLTLLFIAYLFQLLAILQLTLINSYVMIKTKVSAIKLFIIEMSVFIVAFFIYADSKMIYWIPSIGFFQPLRYFVDKGLFALGDDIALFSRNEVIFLVIIALTIIIIFTLKSNKIRMFLILFVLVGCQSNPIYDETVNYHNNEFNCNEIVCVNPVEGLLVDLNSEDVFQINRNITDDYDSILNGYMFHQYYYFITKNEMKWSLHRLDTKSFEQVKIHEESLREYDLFGKVKTSLSKRTPLDIFVDKDRVFFIYHDRIDVLNKHQKIETLLFEHARIIKIEQDNLYFVNAKNQLEVLNLVDQIRTVLMDTLVIHAQIEDDYIYYDTLKDERVYRFNRKNGETELLIDDTVNFFHVVSNSVYYTSVGGRGIHIYEIDSQKESTLLSQHAVYSINIIGDIINFTALDTETHIISWFQYRDHTIHMIYD